MKDAYRSPCPCLRLVILAALQDIGRTKEEEQRYPKAAATVCAEHRCQHEGCTSERGTNEIKTKRIIAQTDMQNPVRARQKLPGL